MLLLPGALGAQVLVGPGESTETAFRREVRGQWFGWLAAQEEGDAALAKSKLEDLLKYSQKIGIRRLSDLALSATLLGRKDLLAGKVDRASLAFDSAVRLDPDLPEARWGRLQLLAKTGGFSQMPGDLLGAMRASLVDHDSRRIVLIRAVLILTLALAAVGAAQVLVLIIVGWRRLYHDLCELAGRRVNRPADRLVAGALLVSPLLVSLDVVWFGLALFVAVFGYASSRQRLAAIVGLLATLPVLPVLGPNRLRPSHLRIADPARRRGARGVAL